MCSWLDRVVVHSRNSCRWWLWKSEQRLHLELLSTMQVHGLYRYHTSFGWSDICSGNHCSYDDISENKERKERGKRLGSWFVVYRVMIKIIRIRARVGVRISFTLPFITGKMVARANAVHSSFTIARFTWLECLSWRNKFKQLYCLLVSFQRIYINR